MEKAIKSIDEHTELIETLGYALISRYKGFRYVIKENIELSPELLHMFTKNCLLFKNRFVYTGTSSGINFFVPDAPFFKLLDTVNKKFLSYFFNSVDRNWVNYSQLVNRFGFNSNFFMESV